jgi:hypothetical protein
LKAIVPVDFLEPAIVALSAGNEPTIVLFHLVGGRRNIPIVLLHVISTFATGTGGCE